MDIMYDEEMVNFHMEAINHKKYIGVLDPQYEMDEIRCAINNEKIWALGSPDEDNVLMHEINIATLEEEYRRLSLMKDDPTLFIINNPVEISYKILEEVFNKNDTTKEDLTIAIEEALGYLGEALK